MELLFSSVYMGVIVTVGLIGNVYCMNQLRTTALRRYAMNRYLLVMAISDSGFLMSLAVLTLYNLGVKILNLPVVCQMTFFLTHLCCFLSGWYIVALSFERCLAVYKPLKCYALFSPQRSSAAILIITSLGFFLNSWPLMAFSVKRDFSIDNNNVTYEQRECEMSEFAEQFYKVLIFYDATISCLAPMSSVLTLNALIVRKIFTASRLRRSMTNASLRESRRRKDGGDCDEFPGIYELATCTTEATRGSEWFKDTANYDYDERFYTPPLVVKTVSHPAKFSLVSRPSAATTTTLSSAERKITWFLLAISFTHLILNAPSYLCRLLLAYLIPIGQYVEDYNIYVVVDQILLLIFYTQFAINFVLYTCRNRRSSAH